MAVLNPLAKIRVILSYAYGEPPTLPWTSPFVSGPGLNAHVSERGHFVKDPDGIFQDLHADSTPRTLTQTHVKAEHRFHPFFFKEYFNANVFKFSYMFQAINWSSRRLP